MNIKELPKQAQKVFTQHIKVNLPPSEEAEATGNGEGVWVLVDTETKAVHDAEARGGNYEGVLDNDSYYYPGLTHGTFIKFTLRGDKRPVASYKWLLDNYGEPNI